MRTSFILITIGLASCGQERSNIVYRTNAGDGVEIIGEAKSTGGALGSINYVMRYSHKNGSGIFFLGENPDEFEVMVSKNKVTIVFCNGSVRRAEPIFIPADKEIFIKVDVELAC